MYSLQQQYASLGKQISHFIVHSYFSSVLKVKSAKLMKLEMSKKKKNICGVTVGADQIVKDWIRRHVDIAVSFIFRRNYGIYFFLTKIKKKKKNILMDMICVSVGTKNKIHTYIYIYIYIKYIIFWLSQIDVMSSS